MLNREGNEFIEENKGNPQKDDLGVLVGLLTKHSL